MTEFLDFARPETPRFGDCMLTEIIDSNLHFLSLEMEKLGITVERDYQGPGGVEADRDLLYRAFFNILLNAIQAMPEGGAITVSISRPYASDGRELGLAQVVIADNGPAWTRK